MTTTTRDDSKARPSGREADQAATTEQPTKADASFVDAKGRRWHLAINCSEIYRLRDEHGLDVGHLQKTDSLAPLYLDSFFFVEIAWGLLEAQAKRQEVSRDDFFAAMDGDAMFAAREAFVAAVANFTDPRLRCVVDAVVERLVVDGGRQMARLIVESAPEDLRDRTTAMSKAAATSAS